MKPPPIPLEQITNLLCKGRVIGAATNDVEAITPEIVAFVSRLPEQRRVLTIEIDDLPGHDRLLEHLSFELSRTAAMLWPDWYGGDVDLSTAEGSERVLTQINERRVAAAEVYVHREWFRGAVKRCLAGEIPALPEFSTTVQVRQLAECLRESSLCILVALLTTPERNHRLRSLERATDWLARETAAEVILVIPERLADDEAFSALRLASFQPSQDASLTIEDTTEKTVRHPEPGGTKSSRRERKHVLQPLIGRPHPASPGEQRLADVLAKDAELAGLFEFNQKVRTILGNAYLVDLTWVAGHVVVEVDGYGIHSTQQAFSADRNRDYELLISGFAVLRIPHDEIMSDAVLAMEKIRDVVRWRRSS